MKIYKKPGKEISRSDKKCIRKNTNAGLRQILKMQI
ncbi:hypothetical protein DORLON_00427 [Dorea longicatena DSM 13814]|uniref:Uncharacterized protein n=1 Tax=Dorea longicatena DSM 13814 TaxID=411462 RepID=A6BDR1_9FIRM|nr:hypothetical protein DORLON_00427 [Dorea longicatena DSM 13814]